MMTTLLTTKLYLPTPRSDLVLRPRLIKQLNTGLSCKFTLISAPAGFGKSTLLSAWGQQAEPRPRIAWLSLDEGDNDLTRFLIYFVAALQTIESDIGQGELVVLQSPGAVNIEAVLTSLLNEIAEFPDDLVLILDDYHVIESKPIDQAVTFLIEHLPPQMHLVIASRIDPSLPLSRLRAHGQMTEIRADDLRFTPDEAVAFLNQVMGFVLSTQEMAALGERTEGWIAGLHLAALALQGTLSMQGFKRSDDIADFINSFTGSNRYIQDYLVDEVLQQRPKGTRNFLLQTSILSRLSAPLCDAVRFGIAETDTKQKNSQAILESLEASNLFIVPLDNERRWYRYHHLFADLLRQRLHHQQPEGVAELHLRASTWYEKNSLEVEALHHAAAANDFERAARLVEGGGYPLYHRGAVAPVLNWLESLPTNLLDTKPSLWVMYAEVLMTRGQLDRAEEKYQAAEAALQDTKLDAEIRDLLGRIANGRASLASFQYQPEKMITLSLRALDLLHPDNLAIRAAVSLTLGCAYQLQGNRTEASQAYTEAITNGQTAEHIIVVILATIRLGDIQAAENQLRQAVQTYQRAVQLSGDHPLPYVGEAYLGLARIYIEWNDLEIAQDYGQKSIELVRQIANIDRSIDCELFFARMKLVQEEVVGATALLDDAYQSAQQYNLTFRLPQIAAEQVLVLLHQGDSAAAANLAQDHDLPISLARVHLAQGDTTVALAILEPLHKQMESKDWKDETLKVMVLQAVALYAHGETNQAVELLGEALALAEPGGLIRTFVDEGAPMAQLLYETATCGIMPEYTSKLLAAFESEEQGDTTPPFQPLIEPLSQRELEVLQLVAKGLSNREISERLFLALDTVKGHNRSIYGKLGVKNRTQAINEAISLKIIPPQ